MKKRAAGTPDSASDNDEYIIHQEGNEEIRISNKVRKQLEWPLYSSLQKSQRPFMLESEASGATELQRVEESENVSETCSDKRRRKSLRKKPRVGMRNRLHAAINDESDRFDLE